MAETPPKRYKLYLETTKKRRSKRTTSFPRAVDEYRQKHNTSGPLNIFDVTNSMKSSIVDGKHSISTNVAGVENVSGVEPENRSNSSSNCEETNLHRHNQDTSIDTQTITTEIKNNTFQPKEHTDFLKQSSNGYDRIMFKESETSINDVITMITGFTLRFGLCNNGRTQLMEMFKLCAGSQYNDVSISDHQYNKIFEIPEETIIAHYYCAKCTKIIYISPKKSMKDTEVICDQCVEIIRLNSLNENYFLSINVEYQLKELLKSKNIYSAISESFNNEYSNNSKITDITDSELFVKFANNNEKTIYLNVSTNGTPIFRESKRSMWPLQILVNNLPPRLRFNNVIIAGFMIVTHEPTPELMNLFMESFVKQIENLNSKGFNLADNNTESNQEKINVAVSNFSADSVTQALCQNRVKHSEYFACSYCYIMGETSDGAKHFPFTATIEELRTHDSHIKDVAKCNKKKPKVECRGVEGPSELLSLPNFDMVWSFPFDSMNTWDLGVTKFLWELILKGLNKEETLRLDELVNTIKPPCTVGIFPKAFTDFNNFEAKDFNALLLFYSIPIGFDIFSDDIMYLLALLSKGLFTLSQHEISEDELNECEEMLIIFVDSFQKIFGESKMKLNVHLLLHAVDSVRKSGPLWANYTYLHEGSIHFLKMLVN
ncbi:GSCOCG00003597001-RA-CDS, partial [Cotesia congregata]